MSKFTFSEDFFKRCKLEIENANYDLSLRETFDKELCSDSVVRYFGSTSNLMKAIGIPFCRVKRRFAPKGGHDHLLKRVFFFRKYGYLKISKMIFDGRDSHSIMENGAKMDSNILLLCDDLQSYTPQDLDAKEFEKLYDMVCKSKHRAKLGKFKHDLSVYDLYEMCDFKPPQVCSVLGISLDYYLGQHGRINSPSLDKIVPSKGYVKGNVRIISHQANTWCSNMTKEQRLLILKDALDEGEEVVITKKAAPDLIK